MLENIIWCHKERLTVVIDKGMNSDGNYAWVDEHARVHFVTTYSTYFVQEFSATAMDRFEPVDTARNRQLIQDGKSQERLLAYRCKGQYWGKQRTVVVTYNPATARKQTYTFQSKLDTLRQHLHSVLSLNKRAGKPIRRLATPTQAQSEVLTAFGHFIDQGGVLHSRSV